jgi:hypothetical protein
MRKGKIESFVFQRKWLICPDFKHGAWISGKFSTLFYETQDGKKLEIANNFEKLISLQEFNIFEEHLKEVRHEIFDLDWVANEKLKQNNIW